MAINKNHLFDDLDGTKCGIVEKDVTEDRKNFLKDLLEANGFEVVVVDSPPPKAAAKPVNAETEGDENADITPPPSLYIVGVTDVTFNSTNAIFGRLLKTKSGKVVTMAYWYQKEAVSNDEVPYYEA